MMLWDVTVHLDPISSDEEKLQVPISCGDCASVVSIGLFCFKIHGGGSTSNVLCKYGYPAWVRMDELLEELKTCIEIVAGKLGGRWKCNVQDCMSFHQAVNGITDSRLEWVQLNTDWSG